MLFLVFTSLLFYLGQYIRTELGCIPMFPLQITHAFTVLLFYLNQYILSELGYIPMFPSRMITLEFTVLLSYLSQYIRSKLGCIPMFPGLAPRGGGSGGFATTVDLFLLSRAS